MHGLEQQFEIGLAGIFKLFSFRSNQTRVSKLITEAKLCSFAQLLILKVVEITIRYNPEYCYLRLEGEANCPDS